MMTNEAKMKIVLEYFEQASDKDNLLRVALDVEEFMYGRMMSNIQSYDLMDNTKYKQIDKLLEVMRETFGYNEDLNGMIKHSITEANFILAKKSMDYKAFMDPFANNSEGDYFNESIRSNR